MKVNLRITIILILILLGLSAKGSNEKEYNAGKMIIEHVIDSHEWHIMNIGEKHISFPLPIIIYDASENKISIFLSNNFEHGNTHYKGYAIGKPDSPQKGKIVKINSDGTYNTGAKIYDFSITKNVFSLFVSILIISILFIYIARVYVKRQLQTTKGIQSFVEPIIIFIRDDIAKPSIGPKYEKYLPYLLTLFFFILINNLLGLVPFFPGGANLTGNISVTGVLAIFTFLITIISGNKMYWQHIFNLPGVPWWLKFPLPLLPIIELISMLTKPIVLMVRLFANITAGHIIALGFISIIFIFGQITPFAGYGSSILSVVFNVFMGLLELLVAFIQAYVFTLLSSLYFGMAIEEHHHKEEQILEHD